MAAVPLLSAAVEPALAVPAVLVHELLIGAFSARSERGDVSWRLLRILGIGSLIGTPVGLLVLATVPTDPMRIIVSATVIVCLLVIWTRQHAPIPLARTTLGLAGLVSGILNGATAMSGPPAIVVLLGSALSARKVRAILIYFIVFSAAIGVGLSLLSGLQGMATATLAALMAPGVVAGAVLGAIGFKRLPQAHYRAVSSACLLLIAIGSLSLSLLAP